jgi:hypothetical protein
MRSCLCEALPRKPSKLRGWPAIAQFLAMPNSTVHRWAKEYATENPRNFASRFDHFFAARGDADMVRFAGAETAVFRASIGCDCFRMLAHRAFCANAILRREAADMIRVGRLTSWTAPVPLRDSIPEIIWSSFSISICAWLRFSRSSRSALSRFDIVTPSGIFDAA